MASHMKKVGMASSEMTFEEQTLLSTAYRSVVNARRISILHLSAVMPTTASRNYCQNIRKELESFCAELLQLIDQRLLPMETSTMSKVYYNKMYSFLNHQPQVLTRISGRATTTDIWRSTDRTNVVMRL